MADVYQCPSFRFIVADAAVHPHPEADPAVDFEFATPAAAGGDGRDHDHGFLVFGRDLRLGGGRGPETSDSDSEDERPAAAAERYCLWTPARASPGHMRKSRSTGEAPACRWRLRDLVLGRSRSDGKERFEFLAPREGADAGGRKTAAGRKGETGMERAHRRWYGGVDAEERRRRRSFAESYRKEAIGFLPSLKGIGGSFLR